MDWGKNVAGCVKRLTSRTGVPGKWRSEVGVTKHQVRIGSDDTSQNPRHWRTSG